MKIKYLGMDSNLMKKLLDRINRIFKNPYGHFPEESGQTQSPSAKNTIFISKDI